MCGGRLRGIKSKFLISKMIQILGLGVGQGTYKSKSLIDQIVKMH